MNGNRVDPARMGVDTDVSENTLYCYEMDLAAGPFAPCPFGSLCDAFDCFYQIMTCVNTGPEPALIGHGLLSRYFPDGSPVDDNEVRALLYACGTVGYDFIGLIHTLERTGLSRRLNTTASNRSSPPP
jgi:hypothetical protein